MYFKSEENRYDINGCIKTAIGTLRSHVLESRKRKPILNDPRAEYYLKKKVKHELGLDAGYSYSFGIKNAKELETYAEGIKVIDEWSFVEDPDTRPRIYKYMGLSRTQWTVTAAINEDM